MIFTVKLSEEDRAHLAQVEALLQEILAATRVRHIYVDPLAGADARRPVWTGNPWPDLLGDLRFELVVCDQRLNRGDAVGLRASIGRLREMVDRIESGFLPFAEHYGSRDHSHADSDES